MKAYITQGTGVSQTLQGADDNVVPVYDSLADAQIDLSNIEEGQIIGTKDEIGTSEILTNVEAQVDKYAENLMQSYGQVIGSYLATENNNATPQGYLLADGRDTTGTEDELLRKYPLLYAYLGNSNVLPYKSNMDSLSNTPDIAITTRSDYRPLGVQYVSDLGTYFNELGLDHSGDGFPYDGYLFIETYHWYYLWIEDVDGTIKGYMVATRDDTQSTMWLPIKKGQKIYGWNRNGAGTPTPDTTFTQSVYTKIYIWYAKTLQYIKAVSGIETPSTEASEVVDAITNATSLLEQDIQDNIGTYATDAVNAIVNDKTVLAEAANNYTQAVVANTQFTDSLLNYEEIWFYSRRSASATNDFLPLFKVTHEQMVDMCNMTGSYSILIPSYGTEYRQMKFNSTGDVVTAVAGGVCVYKVIGYRKRS